MISCSVVPLIGGWYSVLKVRVRLARFQFNIRSVEKFVLSKHKRI